MKLLYKIILTTNLHIVTQSIKVPDPAPPQRITRRDPVKFISISVWLDILSGALQVHLDRREEECGVWGDGSSSTHSFFKWLPINKASTFDRLYEFQQPEKIQSLVLNDNRISDLDRNAFSNCRMINLQKVEERGKAIFKDYFVWLIAGLSPKLLHLSCGPISL